MVIRKRREKQKKKKEKRKIPFFSIFFSIDAIDSTRYSQPFLFFFLTTLSYKKSNVNKIWSSFVFRKKLLYSETFETRGYGKPRRRTILSPTFLLFVQLISTDGKTFNRAGPIVASSKGRRNSSQVKSRP